MRVTFTALFIASTVFVHAQMSSLEVMGSTALINNEGDRLNGTRDILLRFNQKIGWYFSGNIAIAYNVTRFNTLPRIHNDYADLKNVYQAIQLGGNFNLLTAIRTYRKGGRPAVGLIEISHKHFKVYICAGAEFLKLRSTDDVQSFKRTTNLYEGIGIEVYRIGKRATTKYPALVPFFESRFFHNINGGYYSSAAGFVNFHKFAFSAGFKFTFGLPAR